MKKDYIIITNNPLVPQMLDEEHEVDYSEISYEDVLGKLETEYTKDICFYHIHYLEA